jgi:hypothetical protein
MTKPLSVLAAICLSAGTAFSADVIVEGSSAPVITHPTAPAITESTTTTTTPPVMSERRSSTTTTTTTPRRLTEGEKDYLEDVNDAREELAEDFDD